MSGNLHALLIGIDCYLPHKLPDGSSYESLGGSVRDIERVEQFLRNEIGQPPEKILKLTASVGPEEKPVEPPEQWPTYENIIGAFWELARGAKPGDQVYIHYSGHGGRPETIYPEIRGEGGFDEALVPCNIGDPAARYLRGPELSYLIRDLSDKKLLVGLVLDCCHSGGVRRGNKKKGEALKRGLAAIDTTPRPRESLVASREQLLGTLRQEPAAAAPAGGTKRNATLHSWLGEPKDYVLLAACRPQDYAFEYPFENGENQGALTYWLLDSLRRGGTGQTYQQLHQRLVAKVRNLFPSQTPMLLGEGDRAFLGTERVVTRHAVTVIAVESDRLLLNVGQAQGARAGLRFAIHPAAVEGKEAAGRGRLAVVEIREVGGTDSWAEIVEATRTLIEQGAQALPLGVGPAADLARMQGLVRLVPSDDPRHAAALERVRAALASDPNGFVRLAADGETVDLKVAVTERDEFEIWEPGDQPLPHLRPALAIDSSGTVETLTGRLTHLTRFRNVSKIENGDDESSLWRKLGTKVLGSQIGFVPGDKPNPRPLEGSPPYELQDGEWLFLEIANNSSRVLNFVVLDLQPDWGISQVFPGKNDTDFWPLEPGEKKVVRLRLWLPEGYTEGSDVFKIFASQGAPSFRWMELQALDKPELKTRGTSPKRGLEELFASLAVKAPATRNATVSAYASEEWTTEQLEVRVRKG